MEMFVWWEAPISTRVELKYASITSGGQCVMMTGAVLMLLWSASSWVMQPPEVSANSVWYKRSFHLNLLLFFVIQVEFHTIMLGLVLVLDQSTLMMLLVLQVIASCWSVLADQS